MIQYLSGTWFDITYYCKPTSRNWWTSDGDNDHTGFRLMLVEVNQ